MHKPPSTIQSDLAKARCNRNVAKSKYEHNAPEIQAWWYQLFDILENDAAIKPDRRLSLLREVFPHRFLHKIGTILSFEDTKFKGTPEPQEEEGEPFEEWKKRSVSNSSQVVTHRSYIDTEEKELCHKEVATDDSSTLKRLDESPAKKNPYLKFFNRKPDRAAIWKELPPLSLAEMSLTEKADAIARGIAKQFVEWIKTLGGDEETSINVAGVMEMFQIAAQTDSTKSIRVELREIPSVTHKVAEYLKVPHLSRTVMLRREIERDKLAAKRKPRYIAFGRRLPSNMQVRPLDKKEFVKWQRCDKVPEKLASMAAVWQGITHLRSTKSYCEYLFNEKPDLKAPKYLVETGMMDPRTFGMKSDMKLVRKDSF